MDPSIGMSMIEGGSNMANWGFSMIDSYRAEHKNYERNKDLMDIQFKNQQELNRQGQALQLDTWNKTGYPAQVAMLKDAGLNPGLVYAKGGTPGTTGSQGGGSASMGSSQMRREPRYMELGQSLMMSAQIKLMEAEANKANTEAKKIGGVDTQLAESNIKKIIAETQNTEVKTELTKIEANIADIERTNKQYLINAELSNIAEQTNKLRLENKITTEAYDSIVKEVQGRAIEQGIRIGLGEANIEKVGVETENLVKEIQLKCTEVVQKWTQLSQEAQKIEIQKIAQDIANKNLEQYTKQTKYNTSVANRIGQWTGIIGNIIRGSATISTSQVNVSK